MFYPFRDETALIVINSYCQKLLEYGVLDSINENKRLFDPNCDEINNTFIRLTRVHNEMNDVDFSIDCDDGGLTESGEEPQSSEELRTFLPSSTGNELISDDSMREMIRSLNSQQKANI